MSGMPVKVDGADFTQPADIRPAPSDIVVMTNGAANGVLASGSADGYAEIRIRLTAIASGADIRLQCSEDGVNNWINVPVEYPGFISGTINLLDWAMGSLPGKYWRVNQSSVSSGMTTGFVHLKRFAGPRSVVALSAGSAAVGVVALGVPNGATSLQATANGANAAVAATLNAASGKLNYISGFVVTGGGATSEALVAVTVTGLKGGTQTHYLSVPAGATKAVQPLALQFSPALEASAVNTAIVVTAAAFGAGNTAASVSAWGHQR